MLCEIFEVSKQTLNDNIESLVNDGEISMDKNVRTEKIPASEGKLYETTIERRGHATANTKKTFV